jgi:hypothetical protein
MSKGINKAAKVRMLLRRNPNTKAGAVVELLDCGMQQAHVLLNTQRKQMGIYRNKDGVFVLDKAPENKASSPEESLNKVPSIVDAHYPIPITITMEEPQHDPVNHPEHYKTGGIETIDFIEAKSLNYNLGNAVKYITRADHKDNRLQDLQKAQWYINREISKAQA